MPIPCVHGLAADDCTICRTLARDRPDEPIAATSVDARQGATLLGRPGGSLAGRVDRLRSPTAVAAGDDHHRHRAWSLLLVVALLVAAGVAAWVLVGVVFTILHLLELVAVGVGAGWAGYRIGHYRGSRQHRRRGESAV